jgi:hypothetical protein
MHEWDIAVKLRAVSVPLAAALIVALVSIGSVPASASSKHKTSSKSSGPAPKWKSVTLSDPNKLVTVTCPTVHFCAAVDFGGNAVISTNPTGKPSAWTMTDIDGTNGLNAISCASIHLCVAVDGSGNASVSTNPTGGASAWTTTEIDTTFYNTLYGVSCPKVTLCVAVDTSGNVITSTNPAGGASAWVTTSGVDPEPPGGNPDANSLETISCPNTTLCVAADFSGNVLTSTNPTGGVSAWKLVAVEPSGSLASMTCPTTHFCMTVGTADMWNSTNPTGGTSAWNKVVFPLPLTSVACPSSRVCVAEDVANEVLSSTHPTGPAKGWPTETFTQTQNHLEGGASCPTSKLCVAVGEDDVITSTNVG